MVSFSSMLDMTILFLTLLPAALGHRERPQPATDRVSLAFSE